MLFRPCYPAASTPYLETIYVNDISCWQRGLRVYGLLVSKTNKNCTPCLQITRNALTHYFIIVGKYFKSRYIQQYHTILSLICHSYLHKVDDNFRFVKLPIIIIHAVKKIHFHNIEGL